MNKSPLNEPGWDHFDRALLASAELDMPESGALGRARHALAAATLGSAVLVSASTSLGASSAAAGVTLVGVPLVALSKALLVGAIVGVGFVGAMNGGFSSALPSRGVASVMQGAAAPRAKAAKALPAAARAVPASPAPAAEALSAELVSGQEAAPRARNVPVVKQPSSPSAVTSLSVEVELLDRARAALAHKDPQAALTALDRYAGLALEHSLGREANLLRIEALRDLGRAGTAAELAKRLADEDPHGLTGQRAQELIR